MYRYSAGVCSVLACMMALLTISVSRLEAGDATPMSTRFDVNDISILWPVPRTADDVTQLISTDEKLADGTTAIWDADVFKQVMETAQRVTLAGSGNSTRQITFDESKAAFEQAKTWKIAGIRIDPSAPGCSEQIVGHFGSRPQIRLIVQPVTTEGTRVVVHDVTAHLVFDFVLGFNAAPGRFPQAIPDKEKFRVVVNDLAALKASLAASGVNTDGKLGVHPALRAKTPGFPEKVRVFLQKHLSSNRLNAVSFMGLQFPEPWIFFAMAKRDQGFVRVGHPSLGAELAQMLSFRDGDHVTPLPVNSTFGAGRGVSTSPLFGSSLNLTTPLISDSLPGANSVVTLRDVPDIIANPQLAHFGNTDCISCHSESTRRSILRLQPTAFQYQRPANVSGIDDSVLATHVWNVRNFGWFVNNREGGGATKESVAMRTANEAAESVEFINRVYFGNDIQPAVAGNAQPEEQVQPPFAARPVANALTLVMTIKSPANRAQLKALLQSKQQLSPEQNPIAIALSKLGNVHFARFVFMGEDKLLVITSYDDDFETYIKSFVREIGEVFDAILEHVEGAPPTPVRDNVDKFLEYVKRNDLKCEEPFFSAYPQLRVQEIIKLQKKSESAIETPRP